MAMPEILNSIKLLFWVAPITEMAWPLQKIPWIKDFIPRVQDSFRKAGYDITTKIIVSEDVLCEIRKSSIPVDGDAVALGQGELLGEYNYNALNEIANYQATRSGSEFFSHLGKLVKGKLGDTYKPDVVVSFSPSPFFRDIYPEALLLYHEYGIFSRKPYPRLFYLDPYGVTSRNFAAEHSAEINAIQPESDSFFDELNSFRETVTEALQSSKQISEYFSGIRNCYSKILLVPLGYEGFADARVNFRYQTQLEFVEHILDVINDDTAVILTQHPGRSALSEDAITSLMSLHTNFIHEPWYSQVAHFSQIALSYCDACITQNSSVAYQAAFLNKLLVTVGGFCDGIADGHCVDDLRNVFSDTPKNRDNFIIWTLRNHSIDSEDLPNHIANILQAWLGTSGANASMANWPSKCSIDRFANRLARWKKNAILPHINCPCAKIYFDSGNGYSESNKIQWNQFYGKSGLRLRKTIHLPDGCKQMRFDPAEMPPVQVSELHLSYENSSIPIHSHNGISRGQSIIFLAPDPKIMFNLPTGAKSIELSVNISTIDKEESIACGVSEIQRLQKHLRDRSAQISACKAEITHLTNSSDLGKESLAAERQRVLDAEERLSAEQRNVASLIAQANNLVSEAKRLAAECASVKSEAKSLSERNADLSQTCKDKENSLVELKTQVARLNAELSETTREKTAQVRQIKSLEQENNALNAALEKCRKELAAADSCVDSISTMMKRNLFRRVIWAAKGSIAGCQPKNNDHS